MPVFRRSKSEPAPTDQQSLKPGGKGRPTPTRKEAEAAAKARSKAAPKTRREQAVERRQRLVRARDAGPVRHLVRDLVDSRLSLMEMLIPVLLLSLIAGWTGVDKLVIFANVLFYATLLTVLVETVMMRFRVHREVPRRFPDASLRGLTFYAFNRAMLLRFLRAPKPTVKIGHPLPEHYR